jgi:hypothetical protein
MPMQECLPSRLQEGVLTDVSRLIFNQR